MSQFTGSLQESNPVPSALFRFRRTPLRKVDSIIGFRVLLREGLR
ncbi:hypothetical protein [Brevibacillus laterosporus]|nr:hypothetical protein [Brevibacillus laterosporus]